MALAWSPRSGAWLRAAPVWIAMAAVAAASWAWLARMSHAMSTPGGASMHAGMAMGSGGAEALIAALAMWSVMMLAMMLPSVAPSASMFATLSARRDAEGARRASASYVTGYVSAWIGYGAAAALAQWLLAHVLLLDPMAQSTSAWLSAAIVLGAGAFQFTPLKQACLSKCRTPLAFFMAKWRDGARGAVVVGLQHGSYCVGCCWALMAVMFVVGAMNLVWMAALTLLILAEKVTPARWRFDRWVGVALLAAGSWVAIAAAASP
ncbi:MAG: DUF2182 domain-containing protein [Caldimonas sp.]